MLVVALAAGEEKIMRQSESSNVWSWLGFLDGGLYCRALTSHN